MPCKERKAVLKAIKKQSAKQKSRVTKVLPNGVGNSADSVRSNSSVNRDWENWVVLHGNAKVAVNDVWGIDKAINVKFKGDKSNALYIVGWKGNGETERTTVSTGGARRNKGATASNN